MTSPFTCPRLLLLLRPSADVVAGAGTGRRQDGRWFKLNPATTAADRPLFAGAFEEECLE